MSETIMPESGDLSDEHLPDLSEGWEGFSGGRDMWEAHKEEVTSGVGISRYDEDGPWSVTTHRPNPARGGMIDTAHVWTFDSLEDALERLNHAIDMIDEHGEEAIDSEMLDDLEDDRGD